MVLVLQDSACSLRPLAPTKVKASVVYPTRLGGVFEGRWVHCQVLVQGQGSVGQEKSLGSDRGWTYARSAIVKTRRVSTFNQRESRGFSQCDIQWALHRCRLCVNLPWPLKLGVLLVRSKKPGTQVY